MVQLWRHESGFSSKGLGGLGQQEVLSGSHHHLECFLVFICLSQEVS